LTQPLRIDELGVPALRIGRSAHCRISPAAGGSCGAEGDYNGYRKSSDRGRLRLYLLQPRYNFIEVDHTILIINDHVPVKVNPATDERDISGRQAARHNFMWLPYDR